VIAAVSLALFLWIELTVSNPLLNLRLLLRRNFGLGSLVCVVIGMALYGSVYLLPVYLSQMQGYNSEQIGMVLAWTGLPQLVLIPFVPILMRYIDTRVLVSAGLAVFALSCFMNLAITPDYAGDQFFVPNLVRALGQSVVLTPLSSLTTSGIERENAGSASAMFNMMRNLGGSIGIAVLETFITRREQFHSNVITARASLLDEATRQRIASLQGHFMSNGASDAESAWHEAVVQIGRTVRAQSYFMAYSDAFYLMGVALLLALAASLAMRKSGSVGGAGAH
jgi:MFS transporter, DHA2 family, multidrug resistance protein